MIKEGKVKTYDMGGKATTLEVAKENREVRDVVGGEEPSLKQQNMNELRAELCEQAAKIGTLFGVRLDYTDESVTHVERILGEVHDEYRRTRDESGLRGVALEFAAYLVSVIERHHGSVDWERDDEALGKDSFPVHWKGGTLFPYGWCLKRIFDGPVDDIRFKWQVHVLQRVAGSA